MSHIWIMPARVVLYILVPFNLVNYINQHVAVSSWDNSCSSDQRSQWREREVAMGAEAA